jgi:hypothetical protein
MKIRLTISAIAFALALAGMSVRAHTSFTTADSAPAVTNVTKCPVTPAPRALPQRAARRFDDSSLSNSGALNLEESGSTRPTRCPNPQSWPPLCR